MSVKLLGRRRLRDLGPVGWAGLAVAFLYIGMALAVMVGWRAPFQASRPSRLALLGIDAVLLVWGVQRMVRGARNPTRDTQVARDVSFLLVNLALAVGMLSLLLGLH